MSLLILTEYQQQDYVQQHKTFFLQDWKKIYYKFRFVFNAYNYVDNFFQVFAHKLHEKNIRWKAS